MDPVKSGKAGQWSWVSAVIRDYWLSYGKWRMVFNSPFFHAAVLISLLLMPAWADGRVQEKALAIIPSMLGFSLAAFTFSLGIGTDSFRLILGARRSGGKPSIVSGLSTAFVHFLFLQTIALVLNILADVHWVKFCLSAFDITWQSLPDVARAVLVLIKWIFCGFSALIFVYAMLSGIPAVLHIYMAAKVFEKFSSKYFTPGDGSGGDSSGPNKQG